MIGGLARLARAVGAIARRDIHLAPEDRLDAALPGFVVERDGREQIAVFGDRDGRHLQLGDAVQELPHPAGAVQQGKLRVQMQMDEFVHSHSIVAGGFELMSYTTRLMPRTSFTMRDEIVASRSCGSRAQSAVMPSRLSTARIATVCS